MADDVWTALVKGILAFGHTRAAGFVADSFSDTGAFVARLAKDTSNTPEVKARFEQLKADIKNLVAAVQPMVNAVKPKITQAKDASAKMAAELGTSPFTLEAAARAATELSLVLDAIDAALLIVADKLSRDQAGNVQPQIKAAITGISEPWKQPFRDVAAGMGQTFNEVAKQLLGIDGATQQLGDRVEFDRPNKTLTLSLAKGSRRTLGPSFSIDETELSAFLNYQTKAVLGLRIQTKMEAGLRSDKLLEHVIPFGGNDPSATATLIQLDTDRGLSFGDSRSKRITLPFSFSQPGVEIRELMIGLPRDDDPDGDGRIEVMGTVAAKFGDTMGLVVEGAGVEIEWKDGSGDHFAVSPRLPTGIGVRVDAGPVAGGGFIRRDGTQYSGILDLKLWEFRLTAIAVLNTDPLSFAVIMAVRFSPAIELSFGFTLNGVGGILAVDRRISTDALRKGIHDGTAQTLLFPKDPLASAPTILDKMVAVFPPQEGGFVVGPIAELGWGSQAGFLTAKLGVVLCLPDPTVVLLGALEIAVPSTKVNDAVKIVDLRGEIYSEFTPDFLLVKIALNNSKLARIAIAGDLGLLIRWAGDADFALSVGGFFPGFRAPKELADLRRVSVDLSPADWLSIRAEGYFALTTSSVQFGGGIFLRAELGPAEGKAWLTIDALFRWAPRFYFEVRISAGLSLSVWGEDFCGVDFRGTLSGTNPWSIEGTASVSFLFWDFDFDLGPFTWGDRDAAPQPVVKLIDVVKTALAEDSAWTPQLPRGADTLVRLIQDDTTPLLVHPLGMLEVKQQRVPLETKIDRLGSSAITGRRVNLEDPKIQGVAAGVVSHAMAEFAPGHFLALSDHQQLSRTGFESMPAGMRVAATAAPIFGPPITVGYEWETCFPREPLKFVILALPVVLDARQKAVAMWTAPAAVNRRTAGNPYATVSQPVSIKDPGLREVRARETLGVVAGATGVFTTTDASEKAGAIAEERGADLELVALGVAA